MIAYQGDLLFSGQKTTLRSNSTKYKGSFMSVEEAAQDKFQTKVEQVC